MESWSPQEQDENRGTDQDQSILQGFATLGGQKADRNGTRLELAVKSARLGAAIKGSAKPLYVGSIPTRASSIFPRYPCRIGFSTRVNGASRAE